jgi:ATP-dependent RNA helicase DeaD
LPDFLSLGVSEAIVTKLNYYGVVKPTPVQEQAIPLVMEGKDIIAQAQTGTGKTLAFVLPILEKVEVDAEHVQALIVTPTRELALQITDEIEKLIQDLNGIDVLAVYGGQDVEKQLKKLKKNVQIVVGTPGRLLDHIRRQTIDLSRISSLVLDEADQMLHIGFLNEVEDIINRTPTTRQTMLFSATMPDEIRKLAKQHMREVQYIQVEKTQGPATTVKQVAIHTFDRAKQGNLIELIETHRPFLAVIFCRTKRRVSKLYDALKSHGFQCDELHGDISQAKRERVMKKFRDAEIQLLIATDVASRGLDVEGVTHVYNYDIPEDAESYIHRIGRTGRAGLTGMAITLYTSNDRATLDMIESELNITIKKQNIGNQEIKEIESKDRDKRPSTKERDTRASNRIFDKAKPRRSESARTRGAEESKPRRSESPTTRGTEGTRARRSDTSKTRGSDTEKPRRSGEFKPWQSDTTKPRGTESRRTETAPERRSKQTDTRPGKKVASMERSPKRPTQQSGRTTPRSGARNNQRNSKKI